MSDINFELFALQQEIDNLKVAISFIADQDRMASLYEQLNQRFTEYIRLSQSRFQDFSTESGLERSVGGE